MRIESMNVENSSHSRLRSPLTQARRSFLDLPRRAQAKSLSRRSATRPSLESLEGRMLLDGASVPSPYLPPSQWLVRRGGFLTGPAQGAPTDVAVNYLTSHAKDLGLSPADISRAIVTDRYTDPDTRVTHLYLRETYNGLEIANANLNINVTADGRVINVGDRFVTGLGVASAVRAATAPALSPVQALRGAAVALGLGQGLGSIAPPAQTVDLVSGGLQQKSMLHASGLSLDAIPAKLHYVATEHGLELAWNVVLRTPGGQHWYTADVSAATGTLVAANDWIDHASYNVYALPGISPDPTPRTILTTPQDPTASPYGWHDTNGATGAEYTDTRGNNVWA